MKLKKVVSNTSIIVLLSIILILLIAYISIPRDKQGFTELYFVDHQDLPKTVDLGKDYDFSFAIHNIEHKIIEYEYEVTLNSDIISRGVERLEHDGLVFISKTFMITDSEKDQYPISVSLLNKDQEIHFWVDIN